MPRAKFIAAVTVCVVVMSACVVLRKTEVAWSQVKNIDEFTQQRPELSAEKNRGDEAYVVINPAARHRLPNQGRAPGLEVSDDVGTRSIHYGVHQRERQQWLEKEALKLAEEKYGTLPPLQPSTRVDAPSANEDAKAAAAAVNSSSLQSEEVTAERTVWDADFLSVLAAARGAEREREDEEFQERWHRLSVGAELWHTTYVPPIAPEEKGRLMNKWTGAEVSTQGEKRHAGAQRILYVITSFDRGKRLGRKFRGVDKLDYVLMMADEMREACEAGFSVQVHLIAAWDAQAVSDVIEERLFCERTGQAVPITFERHSPQIREGLSVKHRLYMKPRLENHDVFIQVEDDMILTVNHILLYLEESENLTNRRGGKSAPDYTFAPGFMRTEPAPGADGPDGEASKRGAEWFEWEIILSRFRGARILGAGVYLTLDKSKVLPYHGNNQALWMATREQLRYLNQNCRYLRYDERTSYKFVEWFSGSLEMFSDACKLIKVFPAARFEDFLVHHRTNNKNGKRGESLPSVPVSMLRLWAGQILRDSSMIREIDDANWHRRRRLKYEQ